MICTPLHPMQYLEGQTLGDLELRVESFPFDPTGEGVVVTFQMANAWTNTLEFTGGDAEAVGVTEDAFGRFAFTLRAALPPELPPGPYDSAFLFEFDGMLCYAPPSGRLRVDILPAPGVGA